MEDLCNRYLGGLPYPAVLQQLKKIEGEKAETRAKKYSCALNRKVSNFNLMILKMR